MYRLHYTTLRMQCNRYTVIAGAVQGIAHVNAGREGDGPDGATRFFESALAIDPLCPEALVGRATVHAIARRLDQACNNTPADSRLVALHEQQSCQQRRSELSATRVMVCSFRERTNVTSRRWRI
jgi:hypothetical protein